MAYRHHIKARFASADGQALLAALQSATPTVAAFYEEREYGKALREVMLLADRVNEYVDQHKPWELAKQDGMDAALHDVCSVCIEAFRLLTIYLKPVLPELAQQVDRALEHQEKVQRTDSETEEAMRAAGVTGKPTVLILDRQW